MRATIALVCLAPVCLVLGCGARTALHEARAHDAAAYGPDVGRDAADPPHDAGTDGGDVSRDAGMDGGDVARDVGTDAAETPSDVGVDASNSCMSTGSFDGTWDGPGASATIVQTGDVLRGSWITNTRPDFVGTIAGVDGRCQVTMTFPDDGTFVATLLPGGCEIDWSNGTVWRKRGCP